MYKGAPIIISNNGLGIPVTPVDEGGLPVRVSENGLGTPVVLSENGAPVTIIDYVQPPEPDPTPEPEGD